MSKEVADLKAAAQASKTNYSESEKEYKTEIENLKSESESLKSKIFDIESNGKYKQENDSLVAEVNSLKTKIISLEKDHDTERTECLLEKDTKIKELKSELENLKNISEHQSDTEIEMEKLKSELLETKTRADDVTKMKETLEMKLFESSQLVNDHEGKEKQLMDELVASSANLESLKESHTQDISEKMSIIDELTNKIMALNESRENDIRSSSEDPKNVNTETATISSKSKNKKKKKNKKNINSQQNKSENLSSLPVVSSESGEELLVLREENKRLKDEVANLQDMVKSVGLDITSLQKKHFDLKNDWESLKSQHDISLNQLSELEVENKQLIDRLKESTESYETSISRLEVEVRGNAKLAKDRFDELSKANEFIAKLRKDQADLTKSVNDLKHLNQELEVSAGEEKTLRDKLESTSTSLKEAEHLVATLRLQAESAESSSSKLEIQITTLRQKIQRLERERNESQDSGKKLKQDFDVLATKKNSWDTERKKLLEELSDIRGLIKLQEAEKVNAESLAESLRKQSDELQMRLRETSDRCEALEEDLSDVHKHLQERIKECTTMRRLLSENQGSEEEKLSEATESIKLLTEERDKLENELVVASLKRSREIEDLRVKIKSMEESLSIASDDKRRHNFEIEELKVSSERSKMQINLDQQELEESRQVIEKLSKALEAAEVGIRESEKSNSVLRKVTEETQQKLERAQKNQKTLIDDLRVLQSENVKLQKTRSSVPVHQPSVTITNSPLRSDNNMASVLVNLSYLKNILFAFLEHKDHREEMVPVLSQLLHFEGNDQDRFWNAFSK